MAESSPDKGAYERKIVQRRFGGQQDVIAAPENEQPAKEAAN
jgi:hypothetical protein